MNVAKSVKRIIAEREVTQKKVATMFYTEKGEESLKYAERNFSRLMNVNNFRVNDVIMVGNVLNYDVNIQFVDRRNGEITYLK